MSGNNSENLISLVLPLFLNIIADVFVVVLSNASDGIEIILVILKFSINTFLISAYELSKNTPSFNTAQQVPFSESKSINNIKLHPSLSFEFKLYFLAKLLILLEQLLNVTLRSVFVLYSLTCSQRLVYCLLFLRCSVSIIDFIC